MERMSADMTDDNLNQIAEFYLRQFCEHIPSRCVGSQQPGCNGFLRGQMGSAFRSTPGFACMDWNHKARRFRPAGSGQALISLSWEVF
jgi:hypothetical protein